MKFTEFWTWKILFAILGKILSMLPWGRLRHFTTFYMERNLWLLILKVTLEYIITHIKWPSPSWSPYINFLLIFLPLAKDHFPLCVLQCLKIDRLLPSSPRHQSKKIPSLPPKIFYLKLETIFWPRGPNLGLLSDLTYNK